jgi:hypothetical protein
MYGLSLDEVREKLKSKSTGRRLLLKAIKNIVFSDVEGLARFSIRARN